MSNIPAGMRRKEATNNGPAFGSTPFIATIAVPQKKNGEMRSRVSSTISITETCTTPSGLLLLSRIVWPLSDDEAISPDQPLVFMALPANLPTTLDSLSVRGTTHSTSDPVPMHSMAPASSASSASTIPRNEEPEAPLLSPLFTMSSPSQAPDAGSSASASLSDTTLRDTSTSLLPFSREKQGFCEYPLLPRWNQPCERRGLNHERLDKGCWCCCCCCRL